MLSPEQVVDEAILFLRNIDSPGSVLRSNHVSNYVNLYGTLNQDRELLIRELEEARKDEDFRAEYFRML